MVLPLSDLGSQYADFELDDTSGLQSNEQVINNAFDKEDEAQDVERFGRANGYEASYTSSEALLEEKGPIHIATGVILHENADGASGNLKNGVEDAQRAVGKTKEDVTIQGVDTFEVSDVGQEAVGMVQKASFKVDQAELALDQTIVGFREGRLIGSVAITSLEGEDVQEEATALARKLDERILAVLRGEVEQPRPRPRQGGAHVQANAGAYVRTNARPERRRVALRRPGELPIQRRDVRRSGRRTGPDDGGRVRGAGPAGVHDQRLPRRRRGRQ